MIRSSLRPWLILMVLLTVAGCGKKTESTADLSPATDIHGVTALAILPSAASLPAGASQQLLATATLAGGASRDATKDVTWTSDNPAVATVDDTPAKRGFVTAVSAGTVTVTVASGAVRGTAKITVPAASNLTGLTLAASDGALYPGNTLKLTATGTFSDGTTHDLTATATWTSATPALATVDKGIVSAIGAGDVKITATSGALSADLMVTVQPKLTLTAHTPAADAKDAVVTDPLTLTFDRAVDPATVAANATVQYKRLTDGDDVALTTIPGTFTYSADGMTAAFAPDPGRLPGAALLVVTVGPETAAKDGTRLAVAVTYRFTTKNALEHLELSIEDGRAAASGHPMETVAFRLTGVDATGQTSDLTATAVWASSDPKVATISNDDGTKGQLAVLTAGLTIVSAAIDGLSVTASFTVDGTAPIPGGAVAPADAAVLVSSVTGDGAVVRFKAPSDDTTTLDNLSYLICYSKTQALTTPADFDPDTVFCEKDARLFFKDATKVINGRVSLLEVSTMYHVNVLVLDEAGNRAAYTEATFTTGPALDAAPPTVSDKTLIVSGVDAAAKTFTLTWAAATDAATAPGDIFYSVYLSETANIATPEDADVNGTKVLTTYGDVSHAFDFLPAGTFYVNVVASDVSGNSLGYTMATVTVPP